MLLPAGARLDDGLLEVMYAIDLPLDKVCGRDLAIQPCAVCSLRSPHCSAAIASKGCMQILTISAVIVQVAALAHALSSGSNPLSLRGHLHSMQVPWLEVHCPDGLQVRDISAVVYTI